MPNWGAEIPVPIVDRKPDFVGNDDVCAVYQNYWYGEKDQFPAKWWNWRRSVTTIKLLADHPYYTKEKTMVISREAAIEALKRLSVAEFMDLEVRETMMGFMKSSHELAKAIQELWDACPEKRPVDNRVIAMRHAWVVDSTFSGDIENKILEGGEDELMIKALSAFDAKLAELQGGK